MFSWLELVPMETHTTQVHTIEAVVLRTVKQEGCEHAYFLDAPEIRAFSGNIGGKKQHIYGGGQQRKNNKRKNWEINCKKRFHHLKTFAEMLPIQWEHKQMTARL